LVFVQVLQYSRLLDWRSLLTHGMVLEEHRDCQTCTWALGIGEIAWITSRPGVPHTSDEPVLLNLVATVVIPPVHDVRQTQRKLDRFVRLKRQLVTSV